MQAIRYRLRPTFEFLRCDIAQRLGRNVDLRIGAESVDELYPETSVIGPPTIALPDQYERVRGCAFGVNPVKEIAEVKGAPRKIKATLRYQFRDVLIDHNAIYSRGRRKVFNPGIRYNQADSRWMELDTVTIRSSMIGCHFFGHWLRDDCATHLLTDQSEMPLSMPTPQWPDRAGYLSLFKQNYTEIFRGYVKRLILFDDISQNAHKAKRLHALRTRVREHIQPSGSTQIVYLMRGRGGNERFLINEMEIVDSLIRRGVTILQAETVGLWQLVSQLLDARIVISVEGSQLSHALFTMRANGGLIVIQPPDRFFNSHMDWARAINIKYAIAVGELKDMGFSLPVDDLLRTIDMLQAELS